MKSGVFIFILITGILLHGHVVSSSFVATSPKSGRCNHHHDRSCLTSPSSSSVTRLHALLPPPLIISGVLRKMRQDKNKANNIPVSREEIKSEAPGLRVGRKAWKWPSVWPYDASFFQPAMAVAEKQRQASMSSLQQNLILSGGSGEGGATTTTGLAPTAKATEATPTKNDKEGTFSTRVDPLQYWNEQTPMSMDAEAIAKLISHLEFYLKDGMSVLELGAGKDSYLGPNLKLSRHVGVSASQAAMDQNPSLTERLIVDLNKVVEDRDVDSDDLRRLASDPFDAVIMTNVIPYLTAPREVFRSAWYLLKPGGCMIVAFGSKEGTKDWHSDAQTTMWKQYNDDQHMWISGSFFEFSASEGWENLIGFDISPDSAKALETADSNPLTAILNKGKANNLFVVQATKASQIIDSIDPNDVESTINSLTWMLPVVESRDKNLVVPRLARIYQSTNDDAIRKAIETNIPLLPTLYEILFKMDQFEFTFSMQAQLASDLLSDPDFCASAAQLEGLKQGLGLKTPGADFWQPIGQQTAAMQIEDKISLLSYIVPRIGSGNAVQDEALQAFVTGLQPTFSIIRSYCPFMTESDVQLLGTELLAVEILTLGRSNREEFAMWLGRQSSATLDAMLLQRKSYNEKAKQDLMEYKVEKAAKERKRQELLTRMNEQIATARRERSLVFNPRTQKMEVYQNPNKKK